MLSLYDDAFDKTKSSLSKLLNESKDTFCLQDCMNGESEKVCQLLEAILKTRFPEANPWENLSLFTEKAIISF